MVRSVWKIALSLLTAAVVGAGSNVEAAFSVRLQNLTTGGDTGPVALTPGSSGSLVLPAAGTGGSVFLNITLALVQPSNGLTVAAINFGRDDEATGNTTDNNIRVTIFSDSVSYLDGAATMRNTRQSAGGLSGGNFLTDRVTTTGNASAFPAALGTFDPAPPLVPVSATTLFSATGGTATGAGRYIQTVIEGTYAYDADAGTGESTTINGLTTLVSVITPVPATAVAAMLALPVFGLGLRRRMKKTVA